LGHGVGQPVLLCMEVDEDQACGHCCSSGEVLWLLWVHELYCKGFSRYSVSRRTSVGTSAVVICSSSKISPKTEWRSWMS